MSRSSVLFACLTFCSLVGCNSRDTATSVSRAIPGELITPTSVNGVVDSERPDPRENHRPTDTSIDGPALDVSAAEFRQHLRNPGLVLVKFGAPWCKPCRLVDGELDRVATDNEGRIAVLRVDVDKEPALAERYGVSSIPRLFLLQDGKKIGDWTGYRQADELQQAIGETTPATPTRYGEVQTNPFAT